MRAIVFRLCRAAHEIEYPRGKYVRRALTVARVQPPGLRAGMTVEIIMIILIALAAASQHVLPQSAACRSLYEQYELGAKNLAYDTAIGRSKTETNEEIKLTVDLMRDNRCKMPTSSPDSFAYMPAATDCQIAEMKSQVDHDLEKTIAPCDRNNWKKDPLFTKKAP